MHQVAYFLARYGEIGTDGKSPLPPRELGVDKWAAAYAGFYARLGEGRPSTSFTNSLRNTRDAFDGHLDTGRIGWRDDTSERKPVRLSDWDRDILDQWKFKSRSDVWHIVSSFYQPIL